MTDLKAEADGFVIPPKTTDEIETDFRDPKRAKSGYYLHVDQQLPKPTFKIVQVDDNNSLVFEVPEVGFYRLRENAVLPTKGTPGSACWDVYAAEDACLWKGQVTVVPIGWRVVIPQGYRIDFRPRSGLAAAHGITVVNSPGTIDEDYQGELKAILGTVSNTCDYRIKTGDRIGQIHLERVLDWNIREISEEELPADTERGTGGHGSTGK
jgi:dUTP pyrophosphatase